MFVGRNLRGISEEKQFNIDSSIGFGYIIVPDNYSRGVSRDKYVKNCFRRERVSLLPERGGTPVHDVFITRQALKEVEFPLTSKNLGSGVIFLTEKNSGHPIIIGTVSKMDESSMGSENAYHIFRRDKENYIVVAFDAKTNQIVIRNTSEEGTPNMRITLQNTQKDAKFDVNVTGEVTIKSTGKIEAESGEEVLVKGDGAEISMDNKIGIKNTSDDLKSIVDDLITAITQITVTTPAGPSGVPINIASFELIKQRLETLMK